MSDPYLISYCSEKFVHHVDIVDDMYGAIRFAGLPAVVVSHSLVSRLTRLRQLGTVFLVRTDVHHTRFVHSVQVSMLCHRAATVCGVSEDARVCIALAGMLHDVGHGPFSHFFDDIIVASLKSLCGLDMKTHEERSVIMTERILRDCGVDDETLIAAVQGLISGEASDWHCHKESLMRECALLGWIVCDRKHGNDLDRLSYLLLDSRYPLVPHPPVDTAWLLRTIANMKVVGHNDKDTAMFHNDARMGIVALQSFRTTMHTSLYKSATITATEAALHDCLVLWMRSGMGLELIGKTKGNLVDIMASIDDSIIYQIADGSEVERFIGKYSASPKRTAGPDAVMDAFHAYSIAFEILERRRKTSKHAELLPLPTVCGAAEYLRLEFKHWWYTYVEDQYIQKDGEVVSFPMGSTELSAGASDVGNSRYHVSVWKSLSTAVRAQVKSSCAPMWHESTGVIVPEPLPGSQCFDIVRVVRRPLGVKRGLHGYDA